jgi:NAD(P)-dependent dehydrogenase (short-subunit alcohol dehydrogenase family)
MFAKSPAGRPGTADEVANLAELLLNNNREGFITGSDFLIDGGTTATYFYANLSL